MGEILGSWKVLVLDVEIIVVERGERTAVEGFIYFRFFVSFYYIALVFSYVGRLSRELYGVLGVFLGLLVILSY